MNAEAEKKKGGSSSIQAMRNYIAAYRWSPAGNFAWRNNEHDGTVSGRMAWAEAGWHYAMHGEFKPPEDTKLGEATPNASPFMDLRNFRTVIDDETFIAEE